MLSKVLMGIIFMLIVLVIVLIRGQKSENLGTCPEGCVSIMNPNPCPYGYKIHPETMMCAPEDTLPK